MAMTDMLKKIFEKLGANALASEQAFRKAAAELGYKAEEIEAAVRDFDGFPLDDDDLNDIVGGLGIQGHNIVNSTFAFGNTTFG
ncbi:MAG: hypothetical protein HPY50_05775 [Firmicutes bacterium]|nr:hypothetical protein [Bacillota bacterium]